MSTKDYKRLQQELEEVKTELESIKAAHWLLANNEAFIFPKEEGDYFAMAEMSNKDQCQMALNANDTFAWSCADAEPFDYKIAPELKKLAQKEGWPGLVRWMANRRGTNPTESSVELMEEYDKALENERERVTRLEFLLKECFVHLDQHDNFPGTADDDPSFLCLTDFEYLLSKIENILSE